jgi:hypothetical protein
MVQPIYVNNITSYKNANNYLKHNIDNSPLNKAQPLGYIAEPEYKDWKCAQLKMIHGSDDYQCPDQSKCRGSVRKEGFSGMKTEYFIEPFNANSCTTDGSGVGCINFIENNKIKPLLNANAQFLQTLSDLSNNNLDLSNNITSYITSRFDLSNNENAHYWDTSDNHLINPVPTLLDTANSDTNTLMIQQNNMYIAGTMTTATLLVLAIMLGSS